MCEIARHIHMFRLVYVDSVFDGATYAQPTLTKNKGKVQVSSRRLICICMCYVKFFKYLDTLAHSV